MFLMSRRMLIYCLADESMIVNGGCIDETNGVMEYWSVGLKKRISEFFITPSLHHSTTPKNVSKFNKIFNILDFVTKALSF